MTKVMVMNLALKADNAASVFSFFPNQADLTITNMTITNMI